MPENWMRIFIGTISIFNQWMNLERLQSTLVLAGSNLLSLANQNISSYVT